MLERYLQAISLADGRDEDPAATRERLKERFPKGATRRMTQLGLLIGAALEDIGPRAEDAIVYASAFAESRALEGFLESFPTASPTLFQTSIHPSAVQQALIARQLPVGEFFPLTGRRQLVAHAVQAALLSTAPRVLLCGGEERGTWLAAQGAASDRTFAFALGLVRESANALARVRLEPIADHAVGALDAAAVHALTLPEFFNALSARRSLDLAAASGLKLEFTWL